MNEYTHYHVMNGNIGRIPDSNEVYLAEANAIDAYEDCIETLSDLYGDPDSISDHFTYWKDQLYYCELLECDDPDFIYEFDIDVTDYVLSYITRNRDLVSMSMLEITNGITTLARDNPIMRNSDLLAIAGEILDIRKRLQAT